MRTQTKGPVYIYDAWLQEQKLDHPVKLPPASAVKVPSRLGPDPAALAKAADMIAAAQHPIIITEYTGRDHGAFHTLVELAETAGIPVYDINSRLSFPSRHPLNASMSKDHFRDADLVVCLDARDWEKQTTERRAPRASSLGGAGERQVDRDRRWRLGYRAGARLQAHEPRNCASWRIRARDPVITEC